jgi:hypothetical protein
VTRRLRQEEGWALVTSVVVTALMLGVVLSTFTLVDAQQRESVTERRRETSFNLTETGLNAQVFTLGGGGWPGTSGGALTPCTASDPGSHCPSDAALRGMHASQDTGEAPVWRTEVRDNGGAASTFYSDAGTADAPGWDANGDRKVWVRSTATVGGRTRAMVALVELQQRGLFVPRMALLAGSLDLTNMGNHGRNVLIDGMGGDVLGAPVAVRCDPLATPSTACLGHPTNGDSVEDMLQGVFAEQVSGPKPLWGSQVPQGRVISPTDLAALKATAQASGTFFSSCPASLPSAKVVYVERCDATYTGNAVVNTEAEPGTLVVERGTIGFGGPFTFHGLVYHANLDELASALVTFNGGGTVVGGVIVEGAGTVDVGSSKDIIRVNGRAFDVRVNANAVAIRNHWREIPTR